MGRKPKPSPVFEVVVRLTEKQFKEIVAVDPTPWEFGRKLVKWYLGEGKPESDVKIERLEERKDGLWVVFVDNDLPDQLIPTAPELNKRRE